MALTERFQFFVEIRPSLVAFDLQRVRVSADLQENLSKLFLEQSEEFTKGDVVKHAFSPSYRPDDHEVLSVSPYDLPDLLLRAATKPMDFAFLTMPFTSASPVVKAIVAVDDGVRSGTRRYFFQYFDGRHILKPQRTFLFKSDMFQQLDDPGVTISERLSAVLVGTELLFRSFHQTSQFLDLTGQFKEASDGEIRSLLDYQCFHKNDADKILAACKPAMRRKFSAILHSKILEHPNATPDRIRAGARKFDIEVQLKGPATARQVVFPEDPKEAMKLLQFLAEELYLGEITDQPFASNSHRKLDANGATKP
jgi:hypothetical protein